jgi:hypothetical protein
LSCASLCNPVAAIAAAPAFAVFNWEWGGAGGARVWTLRWLLHNGATVPELEQPEPLSEVLDDDKLVLVINRFKQFYEGTVDKRNY